MFACLAGISAYTRPGVGAEPNFSYDFDVYAQEYLLFLHARLSAEGLRVFDHVEGLTLMPKEKLEEFVKAALVFYAEPERRRFLGFLSLFGRFD